MACVIKDDDKYYPRIFLEEPLYVNKYVKKTTIFIDEK